MSISFTNLCRATFVTAMVMMVTGCKTSNHIAQSIGVTRAPVSPSNFFLNEEKIYDTQRVVMMPVHAPDAALISEEAIDQQFLSKLTATQLFEVVYINREDLIRRFGQRSYSSAAVLSDTLLDYIEDTTAADAVVFFDITTYHPYQPIRVGIRAKMITLHEQKVVWAVDQLFDASSRKLMKDAKRYEKKRMARFDATKQHDSILITPSRFMGYAAEKCILTLPENSLSKGF